MRINARLDEDTAQLVTELTTGTGKSVSVVVREAIAVYHAQLREKQPRPKSKFLALIGKGDSGRSDIASNVKPFVAEALEAKFARSHPQRSK